jgi:hypothetical protein
MCAVATSACAALGGIEDLRFTSGTAAQDAGGVPSDASAPLATDSGGQAADATSGGLTDAASDAGGLSLGASYFAMNVYPAVVADCGTCHLQGTLGARVFFAATAAGTYALFKTARYDSSPAAANPFLNKGPHTGPALTAPESTTVTTWITLEADGGI